MELGDLGKSDARNVLAVPPAVPGPWRATLELLRMKIGVTQEGLAREVGVTVSTVNRWENGHAEPSYLALRSLKMLAERAGVALAAKA